MVKTNFAVALAATCLLAACSAENMPSTGSVHPTPIALGDGTLGYVYQGAANLGFHHEQAGLAMNAHCQELGYRQAYMVDRQIETIGTVDFGYGATISKAQWTVFKCL